MVYVLYYVCYILFLHPEASTLVMNWFATSTSSVWSLVTCLPFTLRTESISISLSLYVYIYIYICHSLYVHIHIHI